jgi:type I restriction-modification system DNA methylase subunit
MSEELVQKGLTEHGLRIGNYEFYNIGSTTLNQLKKCGAIPDKDYKEYGIRKPDAILVDRRNRKRVKVICVVEGKPTEKFDSDQKRTGSVQQCNDLSQVLDADIGIATDYSSFIWFNPRQANSKTEYEDETTGMRRSYTIIEDENASDFIKEFVIEQKQDEEDITKLGAKTRASIQNMELVRKNISPINSRLIKEDVKDPTKLATQIWQDVWFATGATAQSCLYTFVELFIFKYLSDLNILTKDGAGNKISFKDIFALSPNEAFLNYTQNARPFLKIMFPESLQDHTTIINGTVLNVNVAQHSLVFYKILKRFNDFGEMKNIDPSFKSKVFEEFMKETISRKNWGQFFTPRNIIDAMIEISDIDKLEEGSKVCDPACGVGGFILEPLKVKEKGVDFYYQVIGDEIKPRLNFYGFDKGFEKEEQLVIILAKANMLIFLSELLKKNPALSEKFSDLFNSTFKLLSNTTLGTLSITERNKYDLILSNPPYVTSGSSSYKEAINSEFRLKEFYKTQGFGTESLFLEWIVNSLKPSKSAFVIIPDGILNRLNGQKLRASLKEECIINAIISLPINAFYRNPKKTYILAITKKPEKSEIDRRGHKQTEPVFTYLVSNVGETLDVKRFPIEDNDLRETVSLYNQFKGAKRSFHTESKRCKIQPIDKFDPARHWSVDRWWSKEEKVDLGIEEQEAVMPLDEFKEKAADLEERIHEMNRQLKELQSEETVQGATTNKEIGLDDGKIFELSIGQRVLKKEVFQSKGTVPVYSSNVFKPFGFLKELNESITDFKLNYVLWGIDGNFEFNVKRIGEKFAVTDHCGAIKILDPKIIPEYLVYQLEIKKYEMGFDRTLRASLANMKTVTLNMPVRSDGSFDEQRQLELVQKYSFLKGMREDIQSQIDELTDATIDLGKEASS